MPKYSLLHPYLVVAPGVALVVEEHVALDVATLGLRHVQVQVSEPPAARHVVGGDEGDLQQVLAEVVGDGLQVVDGGQRHRELQHFVRLRGGFLQEEDVVRGEFAPGVPLDHGADHLQVVVVMNVFLLSLFRAINIRRFWRFIAIRCFRRFPWFLFLTAC